MCKVYTGYCGTREIEHGLYACKVDNPLAKTRGLSLCTGAQTMLYLSLVVLVVVFFFISIVCIIGIQITKYFHDEICSYVVFQMF